jgi:uncharacterized membrane protein (UPF0127 family)
LLTSAVLLYCWSAHAEAPAAGNACPEPEILKRETLSVHTRDSLLRLTVEIADSARERAAGLMCRTELGDIDGMLFVYPKPEVARMWMKNTYIPLDILFVSDKGRIVHIAANLVAEQKGSFSPQVPVKSVLELPAGSAERHDIRVGDLVVREP